MTLGSEQSQTGLLMSLGIGCCHKDTPSCNQVPLLTPQAGTLGGQSSYPAALHNLMANYARHLVAVANASKPYFINSREHQIRSENYSDHTALCDQDRFDLLFPQQNYLVCPLSFSKVSWLDNKSHGCLTHKTFQPTFCCLNLNTEIWRTPTLHKATAVTLQGPPKGTHIVSLISYGWVGGLHR